MFSLVNAVTRIGEIGINFCTQLGDAGIFLGRVIVRRLPNNHFWTALVRQIYFVGVYSLLIVLVSGLFIGMVVALQGFNTLERFGAEQELGQLIALSVTRELGPVVTALLFAGRAGSALAAEIGLMCATEQLSAMEMMAVDPLVKVIAPRFWAGVISLPLLTILFDVVAIYGGHLVGVSWLGVDNGSFWANMQTATHFRIDILNGLIKSFVFGIVITWTAVYQGFIAEPNSEGVGRATTKTVVFGSLLVLGMDFVLTALMMGGW